MDRLDEIPPRTTRDVNTGVPVVEVTRKAQRKYGWLGGYAETEVMPGLVSRGLYEGQEQRGFWKITRAGESARSELERNLAAHGRERLSLWVDDDPAQALAFLAVAGSSPLLIEELYPDLRRLRERPIPKPARTSAQREGQRATIPKPYGEMRSVTSTSTLSISAFSRL